MVSSMTCASFSVSAEMCLTPNTFSWATTWIAATSASSVSSCSFYDECMQKYGSTNAWKYFVDVFDCLSIAALIDDKIMCVHGGISPFIRTVDHINSIYRFQEVANEGLYADLLWSDPEVDIQG